MIPARTFRLDAGPPETEVFARFVACLRHGPLERRAYPKRVRASCVSSHRAGYLYSLCLVFKVPNENSTPPPKLNLFCINSRHPHINELECWAVPFSQVRPHGPIQHYQIKPTRAVQRCVTNPRPVSGTSLTQSPLDITVQV